jgi:hypothetical protein
VFIHQHSLLSTWQKTHLCNKTDQLSKVLTILNYIRLHRPNPLYTLKVVPLLQEFVVVSYRIPLYEVLQLWKIGGEESSSIGVLSSHIKVSSVFSQ